MKTRSLRALAAPLALTLAVLAETIATTALKLSNEFTRLGPSIVCVLAYAVSYYLLTVVMRSLPVGVVYAVWSAMGIVLISLIGWLFLKQSLDTPAIIGLGLIVAGVLVINLFSDATA